MNPIYLSQYSFANDWSFKILKFFDDFLPELEECWPTHRLVVQICEMLNVQPETHVA